MPTAVAFPPAATDRHERGQRIPAKTKDKKLKANIKRTEQRIQQAQDEAAATELLDVEDSGHLEAEGLERTYKFRQDALKKAVDVTTAQKAFALDMAFGDYRCDFTRNGRYLLLGGRKGHVSSVDWKSGRLACEFHVKETVKDVAYLHNESLFAVAQKKYVYVYDGTGLEVHCLKHHVEANALAFLPYHYLLASVGVTGYLKYQDISTGDIVSEHRTRLGPCSVLTQNKHNSILHTGHLNGVVNFWTPNMSDAAVKVLAHRGPVRAVAVDREGRYMVTAGQDSQLKVWDVRTYKELHAYFTPTPASSLSISDSGLLAVSWGTHISVWKDALQTKQRSPYMTHHEPASPITTLKFAPFEDFLGAGHRQGYTSIIVPGAGEANYDAFEANPYQSKQQRRTTEVRGLLEKLQPSMISLAPFIGDVDVTAAETRRTATTASSSLKKAIGPGPGRGPGKEGQSDGNGENEGEGEGAAVGGGTGSKGEGEGKEYAPRAKQRGRNSALRRVLRKKNRGVVDARRVKVEALLRQEKEMKADRVARERGTPGRARSVGAALGRFVGAVQSK